MGNYTVDSSNTLKFVEHLQDPHFGHVDVFRTDDGRFVMKIIRTHIVGEARHGLFRRVVEWVQKSGPEYVVPVMHIQSQIEKGLCIQVEESEVYAEYFNFTLLDLLRAKKELEEAELWFILTALLTLTTSLRKNRLAINLTIDKVFITLKGNPCVYFHHFLSFEESILYSEYSMGQQISIILLQLCIGEEVQALECAETKDLLLLVARVCSKFKLLGRLLKELLNREKSEEEMLREILTLIEAGQINKFNEIKLNKFRYALPEYSNEKAASIKQPEKKKSASNAPIGFKPKKASQSALRTLQNSQSQNVQKSELELKRGQLARKLSDILPKKQEAEKLFQQLARRKAESQLKMEQMLMRKQQIKQDAQKENKELGLFSRKRSQPHRGKEKRITQVSKGSKYR